MRRLTYAFALALLVGASAKGQAAPAQGVPASVTRNVQIPAASLSHFETAMQAISEQAKVTILAEGAPLHAEVIGAPLAILQHTVPPDQTLPLDAALEGAAAAFDYDVEPVNAHLYLLHKHYSDPEDLPLVTYDEMVHALGEMLKVLKPYDSENSARFDETGEPRYVSAGRLVESLSPEQRATAATALPMAVLDAKQRQWAIDAENAHYLRNTSRRLEDTLQRLQTLSNPQTSLVGDVDGDRYTLRYRDPPKPNETSSTNLFKFTLHLHGRSSKNANSAPSSTALINSSPETSRLAAGMMATALPETVTLKVAAIQNSPGSFAGESSAIQVSVDKAIEAKPVTIFGTVFSTRPHFIRALAALYDLRLLVPNTKNFRLALPVVHTTQNIGDVPIELRRLTPLPCRVVLAALPASVLHAKKTLPDVDADPLYWFPALANRLLARFFPPLKDQPVPAVSFDTPLREPGDETVRLVAIDLFTFLGMSAVETLVHNDRNLPYYATNGNKEFLYITENSSGKRSLGFGVQGKGQAASHSAYDNLPLPHPTSD